MKWIKDYWYHLSTLRVPSGHLMRFFFYLPFSVGIWALFYYVPYFGVAIIGLGIFYALWVVISLLFGSL